MEPRNLVVVTGGGTGIGRGLVHHFVAAGARVVTCGRRLERLEETKRTCPKPDAVTIVACDIGTDEGRSALLAAVPRDVPMRLLVHNAAIGDPAPIDNIDVAHFEAAFRVNVVAPLALTQAFLSQLRGGGRVLHLGTGVAFNVQHATGTYGITKIAFHRLYQQMNADDLGVPCGSLSPGLVDTEGVQDHLHKARNLSLPHVAYFDMAFEKGWTTPMAELMDFVDHLLALDAETFASKQWRFSEWRQRAAEAINGKSPAHHNPALGAVGTVTMASLIAGLIAYWVFGRRARL